MLTWALKKLLGTSHEREIKELKEQSAVYLDLLHKKFVEDK